MRLDDTPRRARMFKKGRGWLARASCPSCSEPWRLLIEVGRTQCVLAFLSSAQLLEDVPDEEGVAGGAQARESYIPIGASNATSVATDGMTLDLFPTPCVDVRANGFPGERGFDDDEAPFPSP